MSFYRLQMETSDKIDKKHDEVLDVAQTSESEREVGAGEYFVTLTDRCIAASSKSACACQTKFGFFFLSISGTQGSGTYKGPCWTK